MSLRTKVLNIGIGVYHLTPGSGTGSAFLVRPTGENIKTVLMFERIFGINPGGAAVATHFAVTGPATGGAGEGFTFTTTALTAANATATNYTGTVEFTAGDSAAILPGHHTLTSGKGTFTATLVAQGTQTLGAADVSNPSGISGLLSINMGPGAAAAFVVTDSGSGDEIVNVPFSITAQTIDSYGNLVTSTNYPPGGGGATLDTSDDGNWTNPTVPLSLTANNWSAGAITVSGCTYAVVNGSLVVTVTDMGDASITGSVTINVSSFEARPMPTLPTLPTFTPAGMGRRGDFRRRRDRRG